MTYWSGWPNGGSSGGFIDATIIPISEHTLMLIVAVVAMMIMMTARKTIRLMMVMEYKTLCPDSDDGGEGGKKTRK